MEYAETSIKGLFLEFSPIRNIFDYEDFLLMTSPKSFFEKKETGLSLKSISDELRFKIESSLVLFLMKEVRYQEQIEKMRLQLFAKHQLDLLELFRLVDLQRNGYLAFSDLRSFFEVCGLEFELCHWESLVFRAKKKKSNNLRCETILFMEFHDLLYPITFFEILSQKDYGKWVSYLDGGERVQDPEADDASRLQSPHPSKYESAEPAELPAQQTLLVTPVKQKQAPEDLGDKTQSRPFKKMQSGDEGTIKKEKLSFGKIRNLRGLCFFDSLYRIPEMEVLPQSTKPIPGFGNWSGARLADSPQDLPSNLKLVHHAENRPFAERTSSSIMSSFRGAEHSFYEAGMNTPWLHYNKKYDLSNIKGSHLTSKFSRYLPVMREAANDMYG